MTDLDANPRFFNLVGDVRAMRRLKPDPVPLDLLRKVLDAGVKAPSGMNTQPWAFVVLTEPDAKQWFARKFFLDGFDHGFTAVIVEHRLDHINTLCRIDNYRSIGHELGIALGHVNVPTHGDISVAGCIFLRDYNGIDGEVLGKSDAKHTHRPL